MRVSDFAGNGVEIEISGNGVPLDRLMTAAREQEASAPSAQHVSCGGSAMLLQWGARQP